MLIKNRLKLSASAIKTYEQCGRKYYYTYVNKPGIERKKWPHLELGNFVHDVLDKFHTTLMSQPAYKWTDAMSNICKTSIKKFNLSQEQRTIAKEMLKTYLGKLDEEGMPNVLSNEQEFKVVLDDDILLKGFIDRIDCEDRKDGKRFHLVDYKTGKSKYLDEFQLLVYGLYLLDKEPELELYKGSYIVLSEDCRSISYTFTKTDLEKVRKKIRGVADAIKSDQTWEPKPQFLCKYCDFNEICPASPHKVAADGRRDW